MCKINKFQKKVHYDRPLQRHCVFQIGMLWNSVTAVETIGYLQ